MQMPGRVYNASSYRYGLNGQEKDTNIQSDHYTAESWEYDSRSGRRWNVDPLAHKLPSWSPYAAFACNPILFVDNDGQFPYTFQVRSFAPPGAFKGFPVGKFH